MITLTARINRAKFYGAVLVMAALVIAVLAVTMTGGAQAQTSGNTYPDPQPCGPGAGTAFQPEPHEITTGHFALFDSYWEWTSQNPNQGIMHTNECPPKMVQTTKTEGRKTVTVTNRSASGIYVDEAIMHVLDKHKVTVVATNAEATAGQLSLEEYPAVRRALGLGEDDSVPDGTKVWWLRLDDPDTTGKDETSDLGMGFSAALFDDKYWYREDDDGNALKAMHYMLEVERYPGSDPADVPHFYAYEAPKAGNAVAEIVWDSTQVHTKPMELDPGDYRPVQWIFTKEGTYELSVHLLGFVRTENPYTKDDSKHANWKRISGNDTETGEVQDYTIQVGKLSETEPPMFGVSLRAHEEASAGAHVGEPIPVFNAEVPTLSYTLSGDGHDKFSVTPRTHPNAAQIVLASGATLDFDSRSSYDLVLKVSDGKDHEGNDDRSIDHSIGVKIDVIQQPHVLIAATDYTPTTGETVQVAVDTLGLPEGVAYSGLSYTIWMKTATGEFYGAIFPALQSDSPVAIGTASRNQAGTYQYTPEVRYTLDGVEHTLHGDPITITWRDSNP